ncbi:ATP-dependent nuclease [Azospirillum sp. B2RO_4]|uniref:ATP-dependent nuclease n=1 Tax=Azospirillum sp. B2RO_4 TaxID=3027796 RepID=UPI003DA9EA2F
MRMHIKNLGCIGSDGLEIALDNVVCIVGRNNVGKSTILRAYELAQTSGKLKEDDFSKFSPNELPEIVLDVYIPDGIGNIGEKWKFMHKGLKIIRNRWIWKSPDESPTRQTWDPEENNNSGEWSNEKVAGIDSVFGSRLPQPLRVDSLQDADKEHDEIIKLVTEPVVSELKKIIDDKESDFSKTVSKLVSDALKPVEDYKEKIEKTSEEVKERFSNIFPDFGLKIKIGFQPPVFDPAKAIASGSSMNIVDSGIETKLRQQGTGSRRALFWSILQVRNAIVRKQKAEEKINKDISEARKKINTEMSKKTPKQSLIDELEARISELKNSQDIDDVALPGHILLIDEPENALHPMAIRSAQNHLYELARDENWQVMITTHSPYFINPLEDHTTIVKIERNGKNSSSKIYRTSSATFSEEDRENLGALLKIDPTLCEMFFGSYPIIVEGDTEQASFIASIVEEKDPLAEKVTLVRARGKALIEPLIRLLTHFGVSFSVLHDIDTPYKSDGSKNGMWAENEKIAKAIGQARAKGLTVRHRVSLPDFERLMGGKQESKNKPFNAYKLIKEDIAKKKHVSNIFYELADSDQHDPYPAEEYSPENSLAVYHSKILSWALANGENDIRIFGKSKEESPT